MPLAGYLWGYQLGYQRSPSPRELDPHPADQGKQWTVLDLNQ